MTKLPWVAYQLCRVGAAEQKDRGVQSYVHREQGSSLCRVSSEASWREPSMVKDVGVERFLEGPGLWETRWSMLFLHLGLGSGDLGVHCGVLPNLSF